MDRLASSIRLCLFTAVLVVAAVASGSGLALLPADSGSQLTDGAEPPAVVGVAAAQESTNRSNETGTNDTELNGSTATETNVSTENLTESDVDPRYENVTVEIQDAEPFEFGTKVFVRQKTVLSVTFAEDESEIAGNISVTVSSSEAVSKLAANRSVYEAADISVPESATETSATLHLVVGALPIQNRENLEVMRYDEEMGEWQPIPTSVISDRTWSTDRGESVLLVEAETAGFSQFAVTEPPNSSADSSESGLNASVFEGVNESNVTEADAETINRFELDPHPDAITVPINDRRPYQPGTTVEIREETVRAITFADELEDFSGLVAVNNSTSARVGELREERSVIRAVNITPTRNANETPATLHLMVRAIAFDDRDSIEVMRYNDEADSWEALDTQLTSKRFWSEEHQASMFRIEAQTPGFSTFAVTEAPETTGSSQSTESSSDDDGSTQASTEAPETDDSGLLFGFGLFEIGIIVLVVGVGSGAVVVVRRR